MWILGSDIDLAGFSNYSMANRTYRYFKGQPLYPFGYGLSYTNFLYENLTVPAKLKAGAAAKVSVKVTNSGNRDGEEVVQLYVSNQNKSVRSALRQLKGFQRISLKKGETKTVIFQLSAEQLSLVNDLGQLFQPNGKMLISVGGGQPGTTISATSNTLSTSMEIFK